MYLKAFNRLGPSSGSGQSPGLRAWGFLLLLIPLLANFPAFAAGNFLVEMVSPQHFRIQPLVSGPVSASLVGNGGSQQLITRQEKGRTVVYARVPPGATLVLRVGPHRLRLWMTTPRDYKVQED